MGSFSSRLSRAVSLMNSQPRISSAGVEESRQEGWEAALAGRQEVAGGTGGWETSLGTARSSLQG